MKNGLKTTSKKGSFGMSQNPTMPIVYGVQE